MAQTMSEGRRNTWGMQHLQNFHHRVNQHNGRIQSWAGVSKRLLSWTMQLQSKAEWNSGDIATQQSSAQFAQNSGDAFTRDPNLTLSGNGINATLNTGSCSGSEENYPAINNEGNTRSTVDLVYDTINQPSYDFFLKSQAFTNRILGLEYYSQEHASMQMSFETLKDGQRISADLHALWTSRPNTIRFLQDPKSLEDALQPQLARRVLVHIRVYTANYFAQFIHLHRIAFEAFPATADVHNAVKQIVSLTKDIVQEVPERRQSQTQSPSASSSRSTMNGVPATEGSQAPRTALALPTMMLWPLFLACTESDTSDRLWILEVLRGMIQPASPNIARTVYLLEELLRRQDQEGSRIDHRALKREIFDGDLNTIY